MQITEEVGSRIRYYRQVRKYSQEQLAEYSGLHPSYIGQLERGEKSPSVETLYKLAKGLNVTLAAMLEGLEECSEQTDNYAYMSYQLIKQQTSKNQEYIYDILEQMLKLEK